MTEYNVAQRLPQTTGKYTSKLRAVCACVQVKDMEAKLKQYGISEMTTNPQDYISRKDHARICDARVATREADLQVNTIICFSK